MRQYPGEGGQGVPVAGDGLMSFGAFEGLFAGVVCPGTARLRVKVQTCSALSWRRVARLYPGWLPLGQSRWRLVV